MEKTFITLEQFNEEYEIVNDFHKKVFNTILNHLKKHGDITIPEEDEDEYKFCYLDKDGTFLTLAVRLESETSFYLDTEDEDGDKCKIYWDDINRDMIIEEKLLELVFNAQPTSVSTINVNGKAYLTRTANHHEGGEVTFGSTELEDALFKNDEHDEYAFDGASAIDNMFYGYVSSELIQSMTDKEFEDYINMNFD